MNLTKHDIAYFHPPALRIDTEVEGLFVVRGLSFSLEDLSIEADGIEVGEYTLDFFSLDPCLADLCAVLAVQLMEHMQLALYVNTVTINLSRSIDIGEIYGTIKDEPADTIFRDLESGSGENVAASKTPQDVKSSQYGVRDSGGRYSELRNQVWDTSPINESRKNARDVEGTNGKQLTEREMRAATCGRLAGSPAVPHTPASSIRVTTLQNLIPRWLARFLARLPLLLRIMLSLLSYLHPITIPSITIAGPGHWLAEILQRRVLDHYLEDSNEAHDLQNQAREWLENAVFSVDFTRISALGQVPVRTMHDVTAGLRCADTTVHRTAPDVVETVMDLEGADLEFVLPSYLLPHHQHLVPEKPSRARRSEEGQQREHGGKHSRAAQVDEDADEAHIYLRAHANLPAATDHSLLEFIVDLANVSKIFEMQQQDQESSEEPGQPDQDSKENGNSEEDAESKPGLRERTKRALRDHVKDRAKQLAMRGLNNDQSEWVKTMVRNTASQLERMHGDVGYSGNIAVSLGPYRGSHELPSKLLP